MYKNFIAKMNERITGVDAHSKWETFSMSNASVVAGVVCIIVFIIAYIFFI